MPLSNSYCVTCMLLVSSLLSSLVASQTSTTKKSDISKDGDAILDCSEITNLAEMAQCLSSRFTAVKNKAAASAPTNYGYPYRVAPPLPPFLRHEPDHPPPTNNIEDLTRRSDGNPPIQRRMQGYSQPNYRNYLDLELDSSLKHRAVEYRPVFQVYTSVPDLPPERHPYFNPHQPTADYYPKPVKTHSRDYTRRRKQGKLPNQVIVHQNGRYLQSPLDTKKQYVKNQNYKYNSGYLADSQYTKENSYDTEYFVPANSPIMGDIRRSLLDYTGARDLMQDEGDYLSSSGVRSFRVKEIQQDYYPFRRSDSNLRDLEIQGSKRVSVAHKNRNE